MDSYTQLRLYTGVAILLAWLGSLTDGFATEDYHALDVTTPVMIVYAGFIFGDSLFRRRMADDD